MIANSSSPSLAEWLNVLPRRYFLDLIVSLDRFLDRSHLSRDLRYATPQKR